MRASPPTSGWNDVAISGPWRTATILPAAAPALGSSGTRASTSTPSPTASTQGARMNTACTGSVEPREVQVVLERVDLSPERVAAHGDVEPAERLLADHAVLDPVGEQDHARRRCRRPAGRSAIRARSGSISSKMRASLAIVVDSPPGRTRPSHRGELGLPSYGDRSRAEVGQDAQVLADVPLQGEDADARARQRQARAQASRAASVRN